MAATPAAAAAAVAAAHSEPCEDAKPPVLKFAKLSPNAHTPTKATPLAAGYDLYAAHDGMIPAKDRGVIKTDLQVALPRGCYGRVAPRSGLAAKNSIDIGAGVIDGDYRGNLGIVLLNFGREPFVVNKGDRIAQLICERIYYAELEECESLDRTERGTLGFGSSGR